MFNTNLVQKGQPEKKKKKKKKLFKKILKKKKKKRQIIVKIFKNQNQFKTHSNLLLACLEIIVEILKYSDWGYRTLVFKNLTSCSHFCDYYYYYYYYYFIW